MKKFKANHFVMRTKTLLAVATSLVIGCGQSELTHAQKKGLRDVSSSGAEVASGNTASMALTLPEPVTSADTLDVILSPKNGTAISKRYAAADQKIQIDGLQPGFYRIDLKILNRKTNTVYASGSGEAQLEKGRTATAKVVLNKVANDTGSLRIEVGYAPEVIDAPGKMCTTEMRLPVCVKSGNGYKVQQFTKNAACEWEPKMVEEVNSSLCKGLPGAEYLPTF